MAAVTDQRSELGVLHHRWVAIKLDLTIVVGCSHKLLTAGEWSVRPVGMVDIRAILTWLPAALHCPAEDAGLSAPKLISEI